MRDYAPIAEKLRTNRFNCPTQYVDAAADAIEALGAALARARDDALGQLLNNIQITDDGHPVATIYDVDTIRFVEGRIRALKGKRND